MRNFGVCPTECADPLEPLKEADKTGQRYILQKILLQSSWPIIVACPARLNPAPNGAGRRIASPKGEHRRPPVFFFRHVGLEFFCLCRSMRYLQRGSLSKVMNFQKARNLYSRVEIPGRNEVSKLRCWGRGAVSKIPYKELTTHKKGPKVRLGVCPW